MRYRTLEWVQPKMFKEMSFDLMNGDERIATYRPLSVWVQSAVVESTRTRLRFLPNAFQTQWTVTEGEGLTVATISGLLKSRGQFTTMEGDTYAWERVNWWGGRRVFRKVAGPEGTAQDVMHVNQAMWTTCTRAEVFMPPNDIPERDRVLLAGLAMHMIALEQMIAVMFAAMMPLFMVVMF